MKYLGLILSCCLSVSCANEYVYKDLSRETEQKQLRTVSTYIHAYLQTYEQNTAIQRAEVEDSDTVTTIFRTRAQGSSLIRAGIRSGSEVQTVENRTIKWQRVKNGDPEQPRTLGAHNLGKPCPSTGDHPWDLAYKEVTCHHLARAASTREVQVNSPLLLV